MEPGFSITVLGSNRVGIAQFTIEPESLAEITRTLGADGSRLLLLADPHTHRARIFTYGVQPETSTPLEKNQLWQELLDAGSISTKHSSTEHSHEFRARARVCQIEDIARQPLLALLYTAFEHVGIQSLLILPLRYDLQCVGCLTLFRSTPSTAGDYRWTHEESNLAQSVAMKLYISAIQRRINQMFGDRVYYDLLTGLPNRLLILQHLTLELAKMQSADEVLAVIFLDLDRFKNINDSLGHGVGDRLLQLIAARLQQTLDPAAIIGRWSGDEFIAIVPALSNVQSVNEFANRILHCFDRPFIFERSFPPLKSNSVYVKASMGIAIARDSGVDSEMLLKDADTALRYAKHHGKNNYEIYTTKTERSALDIFQLENILDRAIDERQLLLHYQPQIDLKTGEIVGVESLLRCQDTYSQLISPADFIPIAEEAGSIVPIGEWVLRTACQQNKLWQEMGLGYFPIAINFSLRQLQDRKLIELIINILAETGLSPAYLEVEITESTAIEDLDLTISILAYLRTMGVKISLDDFGTGYSSLTALKYLPLDRIKIDRLFIRELKVKTIDASIVKTIINLGHELALNIIAEGVETIEQLEFLKSIDCDAVQGFLFSRPLPASDLESLIVKGGYWHHKI